MVNGAQSGSGFLKPVELDRSFVVICLIILTGDTARGVLFPTLYGRVTAMGGNHVTQGLTVAAFSAGRVIASPYFGRWSEARGRKSILKTCSLIIILGTIMNSFARSNIELIVAQAVTGVGSATLVSTTSCVEEVAAAVGVSPISSSLAHGRLHVIGRDALVRDVANERRGAYVEGGAADCGAVRGLYRHALRRVALQRPARGCGL